MMKARFANGKGRPDYVPGARRDRKQTEAEAVWRVGFAHRLRSIMAVAELRNVELAKALDVTEQRVSNWINNAATPSPYQIARICKRYGISADYLFSGDVSSLRVKWADGLERVAGGRLPDDRRERATVD